jgi:hypothetical protein
VWGGLIWSREYSVVERVLKVSASEFTSYLHHRKIWKTLAQGYTATVEVIGDLAHVVFSTGIPTPLKGGSTVKIEFNEISNFSYNGYYKVSTGQLSTVNEFYLEEAKSRASVSAIKRADNTVTITTSTPHGFHVGDSVTVDITDDTSYNGTYKITAVIGALSDQFTYTLPGADTEGFVDIYDGTVVRQLPQGIYQLASIVIRTDTYDYVRNIIEAMSTDFNGVKFPNSEIEPGLRYQFEVANKEANQYGNVIINTVEAHGLAVGQSVEIADVDETSTTIFNGEHQVTDVVDDYTFVYAGPYGGGVIPSTAVAIKTADINGVSASRGIATIYRVNTLSKFTIGQHIDVSCEFYLGGFASSFNGTYVITAVNDSEKTIQYKIDNKGALPYIPFTQPIATIGGTAYETVSASLNGSVGEITTAVPYGTVVDGTSTVTLTNVDLEHPITNKYWDAGKQTATVTTEDEHQMAVGDVISVYGLQDNFSLISKTITGTGSTKDVTLTTKVTHNLNKGDTVSISDLQDVYSIDSKTMIGNVATVTTKVEHNLVAGSVVNVDAGSDIFYVTSAKLTDGVATLTIGANNCRVNDQITVSNLKDSRKVISHTLVDGVATVTFDFPHNFSVNDEITISGTGDVMYDGTHQITETTNQTIGFKATTSQAIVNANTAYNNAVTSAKNRKVKVVSNDPTVKAKLAALNKLKDALSTANTGTIPSSGVAKSKTSIFNGIYTISSVTATTVSYNKPSVNDELPRNVDIIYADIKKYSASGNSVTITLNATPPYAVGDTIRVRYTGNTRIDSPSGTDDWFTLSGVDYSANTITYESKGSDVAEVTPSSVILNGVYSTTRAKADSIFSGRYRVSAIPAVGGTPYRKSFSYTKTSNVLIRYSSATLCELTLEDFHNYAVGDYIVVAGVGSRYNTSSVKIESVENTVVSISGTDTNVVKITYLLSGTAEASTTTTGTVTAVRNDVLTRGAVAQVSATAKICTIITTGIVLSAGDTILVATGNSRFDGTFVVASATANSNGTRTYTYAYTGAVTSLTTITGGVVTRLVAGLPFGTSILNTSATTTDVEPTVKTDSIHNNTDANPTWTITKVSADTFTFSQTVPSAVSQVTVDGHVKKPSVFNTSNAIITGVSTNSFQYPLVISGLSTNLNEDTAGQSGFAVERSTFSGTYTITSHDVSANSVRFSKYATRSITLATATTSTCTVVLPINTDNYTVGTGITIGGTFSISGDNTDRFLGTFTIASVTYTSTTVTITYNSPGIAVTSGTSSLTLTRQRTIDVVGTPGYGHAKTTPRAIVSSFGPFPSNSDIGIKFSTAEYSGVNVIPTTVRGSELKTVGEVLDSYSDGITGFTYRIDCSYDADTNKFIKTFVLIANDVPGTPPTGEVSPLSRFGADKTVFEYPGNIITMSMNETAETSATRFFTTGEISGGANIGPNISVYSANDLLKGSGGDGRRWPILDADQKVSKINDKTTLYAYAKKYMVEASPPDIKMSMTVNGSLNPFVGTYAPGDWCSIIVQDYFVSERLSAGYETRPDVIVRKIDSYSVTVPDGTTFPESVQLTLLPEWAIDKVGE